MNSQTEHMPHSFLRIATTHLNASLGPVLHAGELAAALRTGTRSGASSSPAAAAISSLFVECSPDLILRCCAEAAADVHQAHALYREARADALPRCPAWEHAVEHLL